MARSAGAGDRVVDVTATRGEGGSPDEARYPSEKMGEVRTHELLRSLEVLGVSEHRFLEGPIDVDMETGLDPAGGPQVRDIMGEVQPDSVLTFGPDGMTGHVAHQDVSRWATEAFHAVGKAGARLYYACYSPEWADEWLDKLTALGMFREPAPVMPRSELAIDFPLPADLLDVKMRSIKEHASQIEELLEVFGEDGLQRVLGEESFSLAAVKDAG
jgi:LmbE family N-acetylglucosaminyl deacetylase